MAQRATSKQEPEHISTIEELHDFLHVTSARVWVFLVVVMVVIVGSIAYASTLTLQNTVQTTARVVVIEDKDEGKEREQYIYVDIPEGFENTVTYGMVATIGTNSGKILAIVNNPESSPSASLELDDSSVMLSSGTYDATIVLGSTTPLSYLLN